MRFRIVILNIIICAILSACTRNNGDIGDFFGEWRLEKLTVDDVEQQLYDLPGDSSPILYTWAFQSSLIRINTMYVHSFRDECMGSWREDGEILELNFTYSDDNDWNIGFYTPPAALHLGRGISRLHIDRLTSKEMVLSKTLDDGRVCTYYLYHPH